jgi:hypothetical protein
MAARLLSAVNRALSEGLRSPITWVLMYRNPVDTILWLVENVVFACTVPGFNEHDLRILPFFVLFAIWLTITKEFLVWLAPPGLLEEPAELQWLRDRARRLQDRDRHVMFRYLRVLVYRVQAALLAGFTFLVQYGASHFANFYLTLVYAQLARLTAEQLARIEANPARLFASARLRLLMSTSSQSRRI